MGTLLMYFQLFLLQKCLKRQKYSTILGGNVHFLPDNNQKIGKKNNHGKNHGIWEKIVYRFFGRFFR